MWELVRFVEGWYNRQRRRGMGGRAWRRRSRIVSGRGGQGRRPTCANRFPHDLPS